MFNVINLATNQFALNADGEVHLWESGSEAAAAALHLSAADGSKWQVRKALGVDLRAVDWRARERERFESGFYEVPFWAAEFHIEIPVDHFLHVSRDNRAMIAFTKDENKGVLDLQTRNRVAAYLVEYCDLDETTAREIEIKHVERYGLASEVKFARTADEIEAIYESCHDNGFNVSSCMTHPASHYESSYHPVRVYGDADLVLAYMSNDDGKVFARTMAWPDKKVFGRLYGDGDRLSRALIALGYKQGSLAGARIRKLVCDHTGRLIVPYIDGVGYVERDGDYHLVIKRDGDIYAQNTSGFGGEESSFSCDHCGDSYDEDDLRSVNTDRRHSESWCPSCRSENSFYYCGERYSTDCAVYVDGEDMPEWIAEDRGYSYCDFSGENTFQECFEVWTISSWGHGLIEQNWSQESVESNAFKCRITGKLYDDKDKAIDQWVPIGEDGDESVQFRFRYVWPDDVPMDYDERVDYRALDNLEFNLTGKAA